MMFKKCLLALIISLTPVVAESSSAAVLDELGDFTATVFQDNFEESAVGGDLVRWTGVNPGWEISSSGSEGIIQKDTEAVTRIAILKNGGDWQDYSMKLALKVTAWGGQTKNFSWSGRQYRNVFWAVGLRYTSAGNGYRLEYVPWMPENGGEKQSFLRLVKYTDGVRTELTRVNSDFHSDLDYLVRFEARGADIRAKVWPAGDAEPESWQISTSDSDHKAGAPALITCNSALLFGGVVIRDTKGHFLYSMKAEGKNLADWDALSGDWSDAPWGRMLTRTDCDKAADGPFVEIPSAADISLNIHCAEKISFIAGNGNENLCKISLGQGLIEVFGKSGKLVASTEFKVSGAWDARIELTLPESGDAKITLQQPGGFPLDYSGAKKLAELSFPFFGGGQLYFGLSGDSSPGSSIDNIEVVSRVDARTALKAYLRYICDWYMNLDLPSGYPKTGSGSPELFIASYCTRTLMAGAEILDEPAYLQEALRWADFVTTSDGVLVPVVTGKGNSAVALRTFVDWSSCINLADIGSVLTGVAVHGEYADSEQRSRYLEVLEGYSRYVLEGSIEDPLHLGRGYNPDGWLYRDGPDKGAFGNAYWWMDLSNDAWDVSTTNVGLQMYAILYAITGNPEYRKISLDATDWFIRKEVDSGKVFEMYHDVIYGGDALITNYMFAADEEMKARIDKAMGGLCQWIVDNQKADGTWNQEETPRNNRTNLVWRLLTWYCDRHPEFSAGREALRRTLDYHLNMANSRSAGVCEILRKTCFTGTSVAELLKPGSTLAEQRVNSNRVREN